MTVEDLLALPARVAELERCLAEVGVHARCRTVQTETPVLALWTPPMTETEVELLPFIAAGFSNQMIANIRRIDERTVRAHVSNMLSKLAMASRTQLALWAIATGQVSVTEAVRLMLEQEPHLAVEVAA